MSTCLLTALPLKITILSVFSTNITSSLVSFRDIVNIDNVLASLLFFGFEVYSFFLVDFGFGLILVAPNLIMLFVSINGVEVIDGNCNGYFT